MLPAVSWVHISACFALYNRLHANADVLLFVVQGNMAAAAAALANSLGAASCGMGSPGAPQSNPLLGYAALLGMGRNPNGGLGTGLHD